VNKQVMRPGLVYKRLFSYATPYWPMFVAATIAMAIYALSEAGFAYMVKPLLNDGFVNRDPETIRTLPIIIVGIFLARGFAGFVSSYGLTWIGRQVIKHLRRDVFGHYLVLPTAFFDTSSAGHLLSRLTYNVEQVAEATTNVVTVIIRDSLTALFLAGLMVYLNWRLALFMLFVGPLIGGMVAVLSRVFRRYSARIQYSMGDVTRVAEEAIGGNRVIKVFNGQEHEARHFDVVNENNRKLHMRLAKVDAGSVPVIQAIMAAGMAGIIFFATRESLAVDVGDFGSFLSAMLLLMAPMKRLTNINASLQRGIAAGSSVFEVLDETPERDLGTLKRDRVRGDIEFRNLGFEYSAEKGPVLRDISLHIPAGQTCAIVGKSGSGKSTLVALLPRFYNPTSGEILLDGERLERYQLKSLRRQVSLVSQDITLFNESIANNIAYGSEGEASRVQIESAAQAAHVMEFVKDLPRGLDTMVGDRGVLLSGGQRQRIAIARALLKDAPVLILDEATSALDTESERYIQNALEELMRDRTTLVIAHRLSTVERANTIVVMHEGRIVEKGTHAQLLELGGYYSNLYKMQFREN
jgi:subfamily B ATP-binding cassette protein MsbA